MIGARGELSGGGAFQLQHAASGLDQRGGGRPGLVARGCDYCDEALAPGLPFCNVDCRDDYEKERAAQAQAGSREALLRSVEAAAPELESRRAPSVNALAVLPGEVPRTFSLPAATPASEALTVRTIAVGDPATLLARRADIAAAERHLAAATARIGIATAGLYPEVQVAGSIGLVAGSLDALGDAGVS